MKSHGRSMDNSNHGTNMEKCEKIFGLVDLKGYGLQRIYTFLTERYKPFWFEKYSKVGYWPWIFTDISKIKD